MADQGVTLVRAKVEEGVAAPEEEEPDYGGDEAAVATKAEPQRAMPDYADLVDDDCAVVGGEVKRSLSPGKEVKEQKAEARRDAMFIGGVQRLTRGHIEDIFVAKRLPLFQMLEYVADDQVVCVFKDAQAAAKALAGVSAGFGDAIIEDDAKPGPGLWRALRGMLEMRQATVADRADKDFKRQHRGGRQVREFRFWEAVKDMDKSILETEDQGRGEKRERPSGEDAIAAAMFDDDSQRRKRQRRQAPLPGATDEESLDILEEMARLDKKILTKEEDKGTASLANDQPLVSVKYEDEPWGDDKNWWEGQSWGREDSRWGREERGGWQHDSRGDEWRAEEDDWWGGGGRNNDSGGKGKGGKGGKGNERKRKGNREEATPAPFPSGAPLDDEEKAKRLRRSQRFNAAPAAVTATKTEA